MNYEALYYKLQKYQQQEEGEGNISLSACLTDEELQYVLYQGYMKMLDDVEIITNDHLKNDPDYLEFIPIDEMHQC